MPLLETFALTIATALAKHMLSAWLGDTWKMQVGQDLLDLLRDSVLGKGARSDAQQIDAIAARIVNQMNPWVKVELPKLDAAERNATVEEVAFTLASAKIDSRLVVDHRLDAGRLNAYLVQLRPDATRQLSEPATALYLRFLGQSSRLIVEYTPRSDDFAGAFAAAVLADHDQTTRLLRGLTDEAGRQAYEFELRYRQALIQRLHRVELFGLPRMDEFAKRQKVSTAYIKLSVEPVWNRESPPKWLTAGIGSFRKDLFFRSCLDITVSALQKRLAKYLHGRDEPGSLDHWLTLEESLLQRNELSRPKPGPRLRAIIRGKAGSGKSTLLLQLANGYASVGLREPREIGTSPVPFFIRLRECVDKGFPTPEEFARASVPMIAGAAPTQWVHNLLDSGRAVVLVDGMDEVPQRVRSEMLSSLQELIATFPAASYFITSRPAAIAEERWREWAQWTESEEFITLELQDMSPVQAEELIDGWHRALAEATSDANEKVEILKLPAELKRQLRTRPELRQLSINPLLCAMLCAVHHDRRQNLPYERARLYRDCVDILLNRRDPGRKIALKEDYPDLSEMQKERLAQSIAYWFLKNGYTDAIFEDIDRHLDSALGLMNLPHVSGTDVRRWLLERSDLLREPMSGRADFTHRTFLEYLAALAAVDSNDFGLLKQNARDDQWRETIILAVGAARPSERAKFLRQLIAKADKLKVLRNRNQLYLLAAACLETRVELDPTVRQLVLDRVALTLPPGSDDEVLMVGRAGDPIVSLLGPDPDYSGEEAANSVAALAQIGTEAALNTIRLYTEDTRWMVLKAIGAAWQSFDRKTYLDSVLRHVSGLTLEKLPDKAELVELRHLEDLNLGGDTIQDISAISVLDKLQTLDLSGTAVANLTPLTGMGSLGWLNISSTKVVDVSALASLSQLRVLHATNMALKDFSPLIKLPALETLFIARSQLEDCSVLSAITNLKSLAADAAVVTQPANIRHLTHLDGVHIYNFGQDSMNLASLLPLRSLQRLHYWGANGVGVTNLPALAELPRLSALMLSGNTVVDLSCVTTLTQLTELGIYNGAIVENWHLISGLTALEELSLFGIQEPVDVFALARLTRLKTLYIRDCKRFDLTSLSPLQNLEELALDAAQAQDLRPLSELPELKRLVIRGPGRIDRQSLSHRKGLVIERL